MKLTVFEDSIYKRKLERTFYRYCALRQPALWLYGLWYLLLGVLRYLHIVTEKYYLEKRWSFLGKVKNLNARIDAFSKRVKFNTLEMGITVLSHHPKKVMEGLLATTVIASEYDTASGKFTDYADYSKICLANSNNYTAYGKIRSPIMEYASSTVYISGKRMFLTKKAYKFALALRIASSVLVTAILASFWAIVGMYFSAKTYTAPWDLFKSYFDNIGLVILNILPVFAFGIILWLIFNSLAVSTFIMGLVTLILSLVNYFKILFRNDPFLFEDFKYIGEAGNITDKYDVSVTWQMIACFVGLIAVSVAIGFIFRTGIRIKFVRPILVIALCGLCYINSFWYLSEKTYKDNSNNSCGIVKWSATQQFISRGFVYPFMHSINTAFDKEPESYDEKETENILAQYTSEDIPADKRVNIISFMLEAYTDMDRFGVLEFTDDVYSYLHELQNEAYHGYLVNDIFAAGTITTERQFLTGMNYLPSFRTNTNSYVWYLRSQGYTVEGYHPSYSWFYNRVNINEHLGFEDYYFDDEILDNTEGHYRYVTNYLMFPDVLNNYKKGIADGKSYFSFNITYQGHSPYADDYRWFDHEYVKNNGYTDGEYTVINNYIFNIDSANQELKKITDELRYDKEPVILIFFGDHMPWLGNNASIYKKLGININLDTEEGFYNYYMTPYVVWANEAAKEITGDDFSGDGGKIGPYMLMSRVFEMLGWKGDDFNQYITDVSKTFTVDHTSGATLTSEGKLSMDENKALSDLLSEYKNVQYYERHNFKYPNLKK